ncbi:FecR family protein [Sinomicrobium weinanense]|uniref:DUF4974 domain-containing protein n=1 Tax=Sinomicrobium weinanense TaxID=2842200 RepID=A0A926JVJ5_9FLAO|nr:FecR domain-containing protein [Sinomicrobium weinanense]MBC9797982.1 DUF4974 domain-containing protein [Sinomicrobium weinanense]MBU3125501.1 DUF4974 domain-containing protein [Sinomicrobium weinanense]
MTKYNLYKAKESIKKKVRARERKRRLNTYKRISIAAMALLFIGFAFNWVYRDKEAPEPSDKIVVGSDKAVLTLENGDQVALTKGKSFRKGTLNSNGEQLVYSKQGPAGKKAGKILYHDLTVPRGGQFSVKLSDGTKVWLNSDTKLKYPSAFREGQTREVELVYGEAYFEVSPGSAHKGSGFSVISNDQRINVLGTEFNISAYTDDKEIVTTLAGGKIALEKGEVHKILHPDQQSRVDKATGNVQIVNVDASRAILWVNGVFVFEDESLDEIMKALSRWYDIKVVFELAERKDFIFTGILERTRSIDDILDLIEVAGQGEVKFEIRDKTVHIK